MGAMQIMRPWYLVVLSIGIVEVFVGMKQVSMDSIPAAPIQVDRQSLYSGHVFIEHTKHTKVKCPNTRTCTE